MMHKYFVPIKYCNIFSAPICPATVCLVTVCILKNAVFREFSPDAVIFLGGSQLSIFSRQKYIKKWLFCIYMLQAKLESGQIRNLPGQNWDLTRDKFIQRK
jgi:hypothetical protein